MKMHFDRAGLDELIAHTKGAETHMGLYDDRSTAVPGLWLVGDNGIYLMSNGQPRLLRSPWSPDFEERKRNKVVYATECDPTTMEFDIWWSVKNNTWGGDDGVVFYPLADFERALLTYRPDQRLTMEISKRRTGIYEMVQVKRESGRGRKKAAA